ncbi:glycosyltransferase family 2 protein [Candidatus Nomurabacteria bacterium]|nr:glycosyltransferase family 2 protein [Candidatus Nomurabacteria bacterium]
MTKISIISALSKSTLPFVDETYETVKKLYLPHDVEIEWCLQQDGDSDPINRSWLTDDIVSYQHNGRHLGAAGTRNQALLRSNSEYLISLDSDDLFKENALMDLLRGFDDEQVAWSAGAWHELCDDGSVKYWRSPLFEGVCEVGWLHTEINRLGTTPFAMNPIMYKRVAIMEVGGWPAFYEWEDTILLSAISGRHKGWMTDKLVGLYRKHEASHSKSKFFQDSKPVMYEYIKEVGEANL